MSVIIFKIDTLNDGQVISKDHENMIKAGTEIEFDPIPENVQRLIKIGVAEEKDAAAADQDPGEDPGEDGVALEDLTKAELESFAKEQEIELPGKATKAEMIEIIEAALTK